MSTARIMPQAPPRRIPPAALFEASSRPFAEQLVEVVKAVAAGSWMQLRPANRSEHAWRAVQKLRQPMRASDLGHVFLKSPKVRGAVMAFMTAMTEHERRRGPRRARNGRRAIDVAVSR